MTEEEAEGAEVALIPIFHSSIIPSFLPLRALRPLWLSFLFGNFEVGLAVCLYYNPIRPEKKKKFQVSGFKFKVLNHCRENASPPGIDRETPEDAAV
jgi:hypothetical protein